MANLIPNENSWVGFVPAAGIAAADLEPTAAEMAAATVVDLTDFLVTITASTTGNTVPTPRLRSLFETSVPGTSTAQFSMDLYRDDANDDAWDALPRGTRGFIVISRFGGSGVDGRPAAADVVEVWPVIVTSRAAGALQSGQVQTFTVTCAVPQEPNEAAVVGGP